MTKLRMVYWWLAGYIVCYHNSPDHIAFCKRRMYHLGKHQAGSGLSWK